MGKQLKMRSFCFCHSDFLEREAETSPHSCVRMQGTAYADLPALFANNPSIFLSIGRVPPL